jgi:hypothetical protein
LCVLAAACASAAQEGDQRVVTDGGIIIEAEQSAPLPALDCSRCPGAPPGACDDALSYPIWLIATARSVREIDYVCLRDPEQDQDFCAIEWRVWVRELREIDMLRGSVHATADGRAFGLSRSERGLANYSHIADGRMLIVGRPAGEHRLQPDEIGLTMSASFSCPVDAIMT